MGTQVGAAVEFGAIVGVAQIEFAAILVPKWEKIATGIHILLCLKPFPTALHIADEAARCFPAVLFRRVALKVDDGTCLPLVSSN